jgi:hypothetical protein
MTNLVSYFSKENLKWLRIIGYYQIISGIIGVLGMAWLFIQDIRISTGIVASIGITISAFCIYAGISILKHFILKPTYYIQGIQVLNFVGLGITYQVILGSALGFGFEWIDSAKFVLNMELFYYFKFAYDSTTNDSIIVVVNFIPIIIINYIMKCTEKAEEKKMLVEVNEIGK